MKKSIHPSYQKVLFIDSASGHRFVCGSTLKPDAKEKFEGVDYPVSYLSISSTSHPFFTGSKQLVDSEGRVEKFKKRFGNKKEYNPEQFADQQSGEQSQQDQPAKPAKQQVAEKAPAKAAKKPEPKKQEAKKPEAKKPEASKSGAKKSK
jgi:large subunit ribosomal protein L31